MQKMAKLKAAAIVADADGALTVWFDYADVDRPRVYGISCGKNKRLADRLAAAAMAGKAIDNPAPIAADVNGKTYADARAHVLGRYLNADLKRLGY